MVFIEWEWRLLGVGFRSSVVLGRGVLKVFIWVLGVMLVIVVVFSSWVVAL